MKADKRIQLKETLIAELSKKNNNTIENYNELKNSNTQLEDELKKKEQMLKIKENEKQRTEKHLREMAGQGSYLKDQMEDLQKLLARAEDEKESRWIYLFVTLFCGSLSSSILIFHLQILLFGYKAIKSN